MTREESVQFIRDKAALLGLTPHALLLRAQINPIYFWRWTTGGMKPSQHFIDQIKRVRPHA